MKMTGRWVVSQRALDLFRSFDEEAITFIEADYQHVNGETYPNKIYWMDVTRGLHAFDVERSNLVFGCAASGERWIRHEGTALIRSDIDSKVHVFREGGGGGATFVSIELRNAMEAAGFERPLFEDVAQRFLIER